MQPHILIVQDDPAARAALARLLGAEGYFVSGAIDGRAAVSRLRREGPHRLVVLDLKAPVMDGWRFLAERHADPELMSVPVVVLAAAAGVNTSALRAMGAQDVLLKPVGPEELLASVRHHCPPTDS